MNKWRQDVERWLASEHASENDPEEKAVQAFAQVFQALPRLDADPEFADRVVRAVWRAERHRRLTHRLVHVAALLLVTLGGITIGYGAIDYAGGWLPRTVVTIAAPGVVWGINVMRAGVMAWLMVARVSAAVGTSLAAPENAVALLGMGLIGITALYALGRLVPSAPSEVVSLEVRT